MISTRICDVPAGGGYRHFPDFVSGTPRLRMWEIARAPAYAVQVRRRSDRRPNFAMRG
jgi:hypothetical protein